MLWWSYFVSLFCWSGAKFRLRLAVSFLEAGDLVLLDGLLVDAEKTEGEVVRIQYTSLTRTDAGFGGCEVIYVERLIVDGEEYR